MRMLFRSFGFLLFSLSTVCAAAPGWLPHAADAHAQVTVRSDAPSDGKVRLLLDVTLDKGWKTYWRTPGDGGFRPTIAWADNAATTWHWPRPTRFDAAGFTSVGYTDRVTFPLVVTTSATDRLQGTLTLSTCSNLCVVSTLPLDVPLGEQATSGFAQAWSTAMAQVPSTGGRIAVTDAVADGDTLTLTATSPDGWQQAGLFFDNPPGVTLSEPRINVEGNQLTAHLSAADAHGEPVRAAGLPPLSLVAFDGVNSQQIGVAIGSPRAFWQTVAIALVGGLILNLMPCVLPVMGMKLASLITLAGSSRRQTRLRFLATAAGMLFSFMVLAGVMSGLRLSGAWIGWGIQFQHPWFLAGMAIVTWLFCFSLAGMLTLRLPSGLTTRLATAGGTGMGGSFLEGAFATLLATPCTAPFLGTAVAVALAAPLPELWAIFMALGMGMSLPWLLVSLFPGVARVMPKPGPWMGRLRAGLVALMLGSSIWLMSLLVPDWGARPVLIVGGAMVAFFLYRCAARLPRHRENLRNLAFVVVFGAGLYAFLAPAPAGRTSGPLAWQPLSQSALDDALKANKRVLVDVTADWCLNCRVNELLVLHRPEVVDALTQPDIVLLQGNWSRPSVEIERFLSRYGASGIPFNAVFGPASSTPAVMSPLLNKDHLLTALERAAPRSPSKIDKDK